jgi:RNA polymerase sigma-70 factor, ECF subfamily
MSAILSAPVTDSGASTRDLDADVAALPNRFTVTYASHFGDVYRFLRRLGVRPRDLEDVCHEVFLVFHRKMDRMIAGVTERAFLLGIASRSAADYRRLKRHSLVELDAGGVAPRETTTGNPEVLYALRHDLEASLERLADERRAVLVMHELEGLSAPEMATVLGIPLNTVYSRIRLARADFERAVIEVQRGAAG